jgi:hypothetical protein
MSGSSTAIVCVERVTRLRAAVFGWYPSPRRRPIASRVAGAIWPVPLSARETVAVERRRAGHVVDRGPPAFTG